MLRSVLVRLALRRLLPLLAVVGLALSPMAASAAAGGMAAPKAALSDHAHHMAMPDMDMSDTAMDAMPCCPGKAPAMPDCGQGCPLMALCLAQLASVVPTADPVPVRVGISVSTPWHGETAFVSLASRPPPEPPRS